MRLEEDSKSEFMVKNQYILVETRFKLAEKVGEIIMTEVRFELTNH